MRGASVLTPSLTSGVIPARLASERLPGKVLLELDGKAMLHHVYANSRGCELLDELLIATDADWVLNELRAALEGAGTTFTVCRSGRDVVPAVKAKMPDVAVLDLQIGSMGGMAVTMALRLVDTTPLEVVASRAGDDETPTTLAIHLRGPEGMLTAITVRGLVDPGVRIHADTANGTLEAQLVRDAMKRGGASVENFPEGFCVDFRDGLWIATNFTETTVTAPVPRPEGATARAGLRLASAESTTL